MNIKTKVALANPENVEMTVCVTMVVKDWRLVFEALKDDQRYEPGRVKSAIVEAINRALASYSRTLDDDHA